MDDRFFHGILGCEVSVCGHKLQNLTPWHLVILNAISSPVVGDETSVKPQDILIFCKVVSVRYPETPDLTPRFKDIFWMFRLKKRRVFLNHVLRLRKWMKTQTSAPKLWETTYSEGASSRTLTSPAMLALVMGLVSKAKMKLAEVWNMRLAEARWCDTTLAEINGSPLRVAYEGEQQPAAALKRKSEAEIVAIARAELSTRDYAKWQAARRKRQQSEKV